MGRMSNVKIICDSSKYFIFLVTCIVCGWGVVHAGRDMSLPAQDVAKGGRTGLLEVRSLTPPLLGAFPAPDSAMRGLAFDGYYLWAANSGDGNSAHGAKIYLIDPNTGVAVDTFNAVGDFSCGLAWDGTYLWYSEYIVGYIYQLDVNTMSVVKSFPAPSTHPFDLAWDGTYLYAVKGNQPYISVIDTSDGREIDSITATYTSPNVRPFGLVFLPRNAPQLLTSDGNYGSNYVNTWNFYTAAWVDQWAADPAVYPSGLAYDSVTERLWVSCYERDSIYVYDVSQVHVLDEESRSIDLARIEIHPNPFNEITEIRCAIPEGVDTRLYSVVGMKIYDSAGRLVKSFIPESSILNQEPVVKWDGTDDNGTELPAGVYLLKTPVRNTAIKLVKLNR
jgi:hypothetical protein